MALPSDPIHFGEWLPDQPALDNPGMVTVTNVFPASGSYEEVPGVEYRGNAMNGRVLNSHWTIAGGGQATAVFAGTPSRLYRQGADNDWDNVSKSGDYSGVKRWEMASFGQRIIAVANGIDPQYYDVGDSTAFADLPNAPQATSIGLVRDFVVLGDINDLGENYVQWSGFNNTEAWSSSRTTQSDFQPLASNGGRVQAIVSGSEGYIFLENTVYRMTYVGPPSIFRLDEIGIGRGTLAPKSVTRLGPYVFYYDPAGFYRLDLRNTQFQPIGQGKVDRWFAENVPASCIVDMQASIFPTRKLVCWTFCRDPSNDHNSDILIYHYELGRWALLELENDSISLLPSPSASLDDLGTLLPGGIDDDSISVDSDLYTGGDLVFSVFGTNHQIGTLTDRGSPLTAAFVTKEFGVEMDNYFMTNLQRIRMSPRSGATGGNLQILYRDELFEPLSLTAPYSINARGKTEAARRSRFQRYRLEVTGGFSKVFGLEVFARAG